MNRRSFVKAGVAALVTSPAAARAQGLVICRQCGREAKPGETVCSHCGAALAKPHAAEPAAPAVTTPDKGAEVIRMAIAVMTGSLRQARELEEKQPEVALFYYQNALALMRLIPAGTQHANVGETIVEGNSRMVQTLLRGRTPCRKCKGTGKFQLDLSKVDRSNKSVKAVEGVACPACKGVGSFAGYRDIDKVRMAILQGRGEFQRRQMVAGDVRVGQALVPAALETLLTNRQRALVMTGVPVPCSLCQLTGRQKCTTCKGTGWVKCDYPGCVNGEVKEARKSDTRQAKRMNDEGNKKCPRCEGLGEKPCETCKGSGSVACKLCEGSGLAPRCSRCTGTGLATCSKCKGTGEVKGSPCPECKGETVILCTACRGEGAGTR